MSTIPWSLCSCGYWHCLVERSGNDICPIQSVSIQIVLDGVPASLDSRFHLVKRQYQLGHHINLRLLRTGMLILVP
uniref:Uncharacterized protein n=1 Tax=Caenorhabditis japonica TaxID=281687 RepID=A0A8R1IWN3_CAEJA